MIPGDQGGGGYQYQLVNIGWPVLSRDAKVSKKSKAAGEGARATRIRGAHKASQLRHTASVGYSQRGFSPNSSSRLRHRTRLLPAPHSCCRTWGISHLLRVLSG